MILSIIIPVFNEEKTILKILQKIEKQIYIKKQIIIVDDCSTDLSLEKLRSLNSKVIILFYIIKKILEKDLALKLPKNI